MIKIGSIDNLSGLADVAEKRGIHFHVDAAWGGPALFSKTLRNKWQASSEPTVSPSTAINSSSLPWGQVSCC